MCATTRTMTVEDVPAVYRLGAACFDASVISYSMWSLVEVAHHLESDHELCRVAELDDVVVGFAIAAASYEQLDDVGHLAWVAVRPDHRSSGLARALLEPILDALRERGKVQVIADVARDNTLVAQLLRAQGFAEVQSLDFFGLKL